MNEMLEKDLLQLFSCKKVKIMIKVIKQAGNYLKEFSAGVLNPLKKSPLK